MLYRTDSSGNLIKIAGNTNGTYGGNSLPVGSIFSSAIPQTSTNCHLLNGDSLSISGIYSGFYNLLVTLVSQGYNLTCSANEYAEDIAKTGNCGKFVINTGDSNVTGIYTDSQDSSVTATITVSAESFKLPTITMFIQGLSNLTNIGDSLQAGLPNIEGTNQIIGNTTLTGAYYQGESGSYYLGQSNSNGRLGFDASLSNPIYGNSETVQPASTQYPYYIVLISGSALSIEANPTLSGNEQNLNSIGIGGVNYKTKTDYSTNEVDTGVKWIDGKTIYRKVVNNLTSPSNSNWTAIYTDSNISTFVTMEGFLISGDGRIINLNHSEQSANIAITYLYPSIEIKIQLSTFYNKSMYLILEYTKTTD